MSTILTRKTKNGNVYDITFRILNEEGKEIQKKLCGFPTKRAAQQGYIEFFKNYTPPSPNRFKSISLNYDVLFDNYKKRMEAELAPSSLYDLTRLFEKYITPHFGGRNVETISKVELNDWQTELWTTKNPKTGKFLAQKYLTKIRSTFNTFLTWCEDTHDIPNLLKGLKKPKRKEMKKEMQFWELDEFLRFQAVCDNVMWRTFFMSLFYSGCRVGEILALTDKDVVFNGKNYSFVINKGLSHKPNNTGKSYIISAPKTATSNRTILLPDAITGQINNYFAYKKQLNQSGNFFFGGDKPLAERTYQRAFISYADLANLKHIRIHDLRHSHASMLIHLNVPITVISKRLGHSSIKMTLERYSHCYSDGDNVVLSAIDCAIESEQNRKN
jgi:integrase